MVHGPAVGLAMLEPLRKDPRTADHYRRHAVRKVCRYRTTGKVVYDEFYPGRSKAILDEIDRALAGHYRLTDDEVDFLIRHDAKYRRPAD